MHMQKIHLGSSVPSVTDGRNLSISGSFVCIVHGLLVLVPSVTIFKGWHLSLTLLNFSLLQNAVFIHRPSRV